MADIVVGPRRQLGRVEFVALLAMSMALAALGIDLMLPAFEEMRSDLGLESGATAITATVSVYFLGLAVGQLIYGPIADRFGRRPAMFLGYGVYALGALAAAVSPTLSILIVARFLWGLGAAGPAVVTRAIVRDTFEGDRMSRAMSLITAVFILVPVIAPSIGAAVVSVVSWRWLMAGCLVAAGLMAIWAQRLPETLHPEHRLPLRFGRIASAARLVVSHRETMLYTLAMTALYGVFTSYIASSENIFAGVFDQAHNYPIIFGGLAASIGAAMLVNAKIVGRFGTRPLSHVTLLGYLAAATALVGLALASGGQPPLLVFLPGLAIMLFAHGLLIPNFTTIALAPMGSVAGTASSVLGAIQLGVGSGLGLLLDRTFDGSVLPISLGFLGYGIIALILVLVAERGQLFQRVIGAVPAS